MRIQKLLVFAVLAFATVTLPGCAMPKQPQSLESMNSDELPAAPVLPTYIRLSPTQPPAPPLEMEPVIKDLQHKTWQPGYYSYESGQFTWVPGAIIDKPSFTAVWMPDHWEKREYGWAFVAGYWQ